MKKSIYFLLASLLSPFAFAEESGEVGSIETTQALSSEIPDSVEMQTTKISDNTELPKILYLVPWKSVDSNQASHHQLVLHSMYGDIFNPQTPEPPENNK